MFNFPRRQQCYHLFGCETHANRPISAQSWDYLVYLRDLAVHMDHLPHHLMMSQSALQSLLLWRHLLTVWNTIKCLHDDISGPCVNLVILAPKQAWTVPLSQISPVTKMCLVISGEVHSEQWETWRRRNNSGWWGSAPAWTLLSDGHPLPFWIWRDRLEGICKVISSTSVRISNAF